jgi:S1-C subfamily serine protease
MHTLQSSHTEAVALEKYSETEINDMYRDSVGKLFVYDEKGDFVSEGSCFVYSKDGWLITNYHVIRNGCVAEAIIGGHTYNVPVVIACDKAVDIALIKISATDLKPVTICKRVQRTGETVYALGSANGCEAIFTKGKITNANLVSDIVTGNVIAEAFARDQTLSYYYANLNSDEIANELRDTAVIAISFICDSMANAFGSIGITAEEFGFIAF